MNDRLEIPSIKWYQMSILRRASPTLQKPTALRVVLFFFFCLESIWEENYSFASFDCDCLFGLVQTIIRGALRQLNHKSSLHLRASDGVLFSSNPWCRIIVWQGGRIAVSLCSTASLNGESPTLQKPTTLRVVLFFFLCPLTKTRV